MTTWYKPTDGAEPPPASAGSGAGEPVAWEVFLPGVGTYDIHSFRWEAAAIAHALLFNEGTIAAVCPLFRQPQPTLTAAERQVLEWAVEVSDSLADCGATGTGGEESHESATLRGLLERTN